MKKAILGKKIGMTQVFADDGNMIPITVIEAGPCIVTQKKTVENEGYAAVQIGFQDMKSHKTKKPLKGHFAKAGVNPKKYLREFRLDDSDSYSVGQEITAAVFAEGDVVDVTSISKGKGFQGVIKRHGYSRGPMTRGSKHHRSGGSLGPSAGQSTVPKGKEMPGRMGGDRVTVQNLTVVRVDEDKNMILIKGAVPGARGALVYLKDAIKGQS